jgi:HSP20 family protein
LHDFRGEGELTPTVDIYTAGNEVVVKAELPGMKREDINVRIVGNDLLLFGEKRSEERVEEKDYVRLERSYGTFRRTLRLPEGVLTDKVKASFKEGVLEVRMPRESRNEGKRIPIE